MKPTSQRLSEVCCRPTTEEDKAILNRFRGRVRLSNDIEIAIHRDGKVHSVSEGSDWWREFGKTITEIPVSQFIDIVEDSLQCLWRLADDFQHITSNPFEINIERDNGDTYQIDVCKSGLVQLDGRNTNAKNYTELIALVTLLK